MIEVIEQVIEEGIEVIEQVIEQAIEQVIEVSFNFFLKGENIHTYLLKNLVEIETI